jgi:hypothetical protein
MKIVTPSTKITLDILNMTVTVEVFEALQQQVGAFKEKLNSTPISNKAAS